MRAINVLALAAAAAFPCACLEMPITRLGPDASVDAGLVDVDLDGGFGPQATCLACIAAPDDPGPGCQATFAPCRADEKCSRIVDCGIETMCFQGPKRAFLNCALPCLARSGVVTSDDPVLQVASNLFQCLANGPCGDICFTSE